jgi:uncharacterized protein (TIGR02246 family)
MKSTGYTVVAVLLASVHGNAFAQGPQTLAAEWAADWNSKNLDAVMQLYAPKPVFLPTVGPRWQGVDMIRKNFAGLLAMYNPHIVLHSIVTQRSGDFGYDSGAYEETVTAVKGGKVIAAKGNYVLLLQRQKNGDWKILEQTWTDLEHPPRL